MLLPVWLRRVVVGVLSTALVVSGWALAGPAAGAEADVTLLVGFVRESPAAVRDQAHGAGRGRLKGSVTGLGVDVVGVPSSEVDRAVRRYLQHPAVEFVDPARRYKTMATPNDPKLVDGTLWGLHNTGAGGGTDDEDVDAPEGWARAGLGAEGTWPMEAVTVGVVDTGVDRSHPDLAGRIVACDQARAGDAKLSAGCSDQNGHGTHVTGTVGAVANNGAGIAGVAPNAGVAMCAALGADGGGWDNDIAACIAHLTRSAAALKIRVINLSIGGGKSGVIERAVNDAAAAGILVVAAAGNDGTTAFSYPASYPSVVSVGATDRTGAAAPFSNHNSAVELSAPGVAILSTVPGGYAAWDGTSMATPHVAGIAALVADRHSLTAAEVRQRLRDTAEDKGAAGRDDHFGHGRVNLCRALLGCRVSPITTPSPPRSVAAAAGDRQASVSWLPPTDDGGDPITSYRVTASPGGSATTVTGTVTQATVGSLANGTAYTFTVTATNGAGTGETSSPSNTVVPATVPGPPQSVSATAGDASASVRWSAPASDGGSVVTGYTVTASPGGATTSVGASARSATIGGLVNGTSYTFTVRAVNAVGRGPGATPGSVTPTAPARSGYWMVDQRGVVHAFGDARHLGNAPVGAPAQDLEPTPTGNGYWVVDAAGSVYGFGDAPFLGGADPLQRGERVTSLSALPSGDGYWLFTTLGRVMARGAAAHLGDMAGVALNGPVLDSIATPTGRGYYLVGSDGGIFAFGDARFAGSMGGATINAPVQSLVPDGDGWGYWLVASDGGIFAFDAAFHGSMGGVALNRPISGMVGMGTGGYLMVAEDGGIFAFGNTAFHGSLGANPPPQPVTAAALLPR